MEKTISILEKVFMLATLPVLPALALGFTVGKNGPVMSINYKLFFPLTIANAVFVWYLIYRVWGMV